MSIRKEIEFFSLLENNNFWHAMRDIFFLPFSRSMVLCFFVVVVVVVIPLFYLSFFSLFLTYSLACLLEKKMKIYNFIFIRWTFFCIHLIVDRNRHKQWRYIETLAHCHLCMCIDQTHTHTHDKAAFDLFIDCDSTGLMLSIPQWNDNGRYVTVSVCLNFSFLFFSFVVFFLYCWICINEFSIFMSNHQSNNTIFANLILLREIYFESKTNRQ